VTAEVAVAGSRVWASVFRLMFRSVPEGRMRRMRFECPEVPIEELVIESRRTPKRLYPCRSRRKKTRVPSASASAPE
jgi:hypothetical protein